MQSVSAGLRAQEPFVALLLEALGEGVYGVDEAGRATFLNPAGCRMLGFTAEEFLGVRQHQAIHHSYPDGTPYPESRCAIYAVLRDGETRHMEGEHFWRRDGSSFPVEYTVTAVRDAGRVVGAVVVFRDVTERLTAEQAVRQAHEGQQALLENLADAAWMKDAELRYVAVNEAFVRVTGFPRVAFLGHTVRDLLPPDIAARYEEADRRVLETGLPDVVEEQPGWGPAVGRRSWVETIRKAVVDPDGRPAGVVGIARDITDRRRREDADRFLAEAGQVIIASLAWTETLQGIATLVVPRMGDWCVVSIFSGEGGVETVEVRAAERGQEDRLREILARHPSAYGPGNDLVGRAILNGQAELLTTLSSAELEALAGHPREVEAIRALAPASALVVPLTAESRASGALILVRGADRSPFSHPDLLLIEEVARRAALAIEHARQHRLANEAIHARDEVLRVVAHDLRSLVSTVSLSIESLRSTDLPEAQRRAAAHGLQAAGRMDRLIQDILDASRVEAGWLPIESTPLDPRALLREALEAAGPLATERKVELVEEPGDPLPAVRADPTRVLQVFSNLLGNAIRFTPEGERIRVKAKRLGNEVVFCVRDAGPGIAPEDLPHVFDRFWRARRAPAGGAGLGLAIARGIVGAHGGRIWAASEVDRGSRFCFTLPLMEAQAAPEPPPAGRAVTGKPSEGSPEEEPPHGPVRVLVVDDHEAIRDGVRAILAGMPGVEVAEEAARGEEAVGKAKLLEPDVVIMDLSLPGVDGFEAMRRIGALGRGIRMVALTAHAPEKSLIKAMEAGASGFVRKASAHQDLIPALRTVLRGGVFLDTQCNGVLVRSLERALEARRRLDTLTDHERDIVRLTAEGYTAQEIAEQVFLSPHTVASYRSHAMRKLGLEHRSDLVHFALETELIGAS